MEESGCKHSIVAIKRFFLSNGVTDREFRDFWESLSEEEKLDFKNQDLD